MIIAVMPATMTPGMPEEGATRLQFNVILENVGRAQTNIAPWNFYLLGGDGQTSIPLQGGTLREHKIEPGEILGTVVAFDVPDADFADTTLNLVWRRTDQETRFAVDAQLDHNDDH